MGVGALQIAYNTHSQKCSTKNCGLSRNYRSHNQCDSTAPNNISNDSWLLPTIQWASNQKLGVLVLIALPLLFGTGCCTSLSFETNHPQTARHHAANFRAHCARLWAIRNNVHTLRPYDCADASTLHYTKDAIMQKVLQSHWLLIIVIPRLYMLCGRDGIYMYIYSDHTLGVTHNKRYRECARAVSLFRYLCLMAHADPSGKNI